MMGRGQRLKPQINSVGLERAKTDQAAQTCHFKGRNPAGREEVVIWFQINTKFVLIN